MDYYFWLQFTIIKQNERYKSRYIYGWKKSQNKYISYGYDYIEKLINKPLDNFREYCIWRVFVPYFINVKGLSTSETFYITMSWLNKCNELLRLKFDATYKVKYELSRVGNYWPITSWDLELENTPLHIRLKSEGVIT